MSIFRRRPRTFWYLATPYSKYPAGIMAAFSEASKQASLLVSEGVRVYCPIAHTHPIAIAGEIDPLDHDVWMPADAPFMEAAHGLIVCKLESWNESKGIKVEIEFFENERKPVVYMEPGVVPQEVKP